MIFENAVISLVLAGLVALPLLEALLRKTLHVGISNSASIVQHLTLVVGMLGAVVAARENRLLALSRLGELLTGRWQKLAAVIAGSTAVAVSALLATAGVDFVLAERPSGQVLAYGLPIWILQTAIPLGFGLIALRLAGHSAESWRGRAVVVLSAIVWILLWHWSPMGALAVLSLATLSGVPAFVSLAGVALVLFKQAGEPIASIPIAQYSLVTNAILPTIPMFTLAGYVLAEGGAPQRLVRVFQAILGRLRGGAAIMTATACAFFTSFTGGSGVTILALGGLLMPVLLSRRYKERDALGLITGAGSLGLLLPPCLPLILYSIVARVPMESMFLGGILPALVMLIATASWGIFAQGPSTGDDTPAFDGREAFSALWQAKWELLMPVVALGALFGGFATPVEAAALTALYALVIETLVYRDLKVTTDLPRVMAECGLLIGGVLLIQSVALGFTNYLVDAEIMTRAADWATSTIHSRWVFLLVLNLFLLIVGCLMEIYAAIVIQAPLLVTIGHAFGIDPVHLGIIFLANLELGYLTPPVGLNLLLSSYRFKKSVPEVLRAVTPLTIVMSAGVLLITYVPALTTTLPRWFGR
ncbi:MAG: TRAP transporter large permease subunit [Acidobacteriota bacterium]